MDIRRLNDGTDYPDWDQHSYDAWDVFKEPLFMYGCEKIIANEFLNELKIDIEQKEVITFRAAPVHFAYLIVNYMRRLQNQHPEIFAKNFCDSIDALNDDY